MFLWGFLCCFLYLSLNSKRICFYPGRFLFPIYLSLWSYSRSNFMMDFYILGFCPVYFTVFWELENLICNFCYQLVIFVEVPVTEDYVADKPWICLFYISILLDSTLTIPYHLLLSFLFLLKLYGFNFCKNSLHEVMLLPRFPMDGFLVACLFRIVTNFNLLFVWDPLKLSFSWANSCWKMWRAVKIINFHPVKMLCNIPCISEMVVVFPKSGMLNRNITRCESILEYSNIELVE